MSLPALLALGAGCRAAPPSPPVTVVDFIKEADRADRRPPAYAVVNSRAGGSSLPAIVGPAPGRLTWTLPLPRGAGFHARVAAATAPVRVRIGVSDDRIYEQLASATLAPGAAWTSVAADLSAYAGWKVSLFYRPDRVSWRLVLSADAVSGAPGEIAWGVPEIVAARRDAREYAERRARLTRSGAP